LELFLNFKVKFLIFYLLALLAFAKRKLKFLFIDVKNGLHI